MAVMQKFKKSNDVIDTQTTAKTSSSSCCVGDCNMFGSIKISIGWACLPHYRSGQGKWSSVTSALKSPQLSWAVAMTKSARRSCVTGERFMSAHWESVIAKAGHPELLPVAEERLSNGNINISAWLSRIESWISKSAGAESENYDVNPSAEYRGSVKNAISSVASSMSWGNQ